MFVSFYNIQFPGFYYDEVLYSNSLYGCKVTGLFDTLSFKVFGTCIPVFVMSYIGALKTYLLLLFKYFTGVESPYLLYRGFSILVSCISIFALYKFNSQLKFKSFANFFVLLLFSFNLSFIYGAKYDWAPASISILFKILFLYYSYKISEKSKVKYVILLLTIASLGIFNKFDFLFFLLPYLITLLFDRKFTRIAVGIVVKRYVQILLLLVFISISLFFLFFKEYVLTLFSSNSIPSISIEDKAHNLKDLLLGKSAIDVILNTVIYSRLEGILVILTLTFLIIFLFCFHKCGIRLSKFEKTFLFGTFLYYVVIFIFPKSGGPQHFITTLPLAFIVLGLFVNKFFSFKLVRYFSVLYLIVYISHNLILWNISQKEFEADNVKIFWSKGIDILYKDFVVPQRNKKVYATDWGIANQLVTFSKNKIVIEEPFRSIRTLGTSVSQKIISSVDTNNSIAIRFYNTNVLPEATNYFPYNNYEHKEVVYYNGRPIYEVFY